MHWNGMLSPPSSPPENKLTADTSDLLGASGGGGLAGWDAFFKALKKGIPWREQV